MVIALLAAVTVLAGGPAPGGAEGNEAPEAPTAQRELAVGGSHNCAIVNSGRVKCWGSNTSGRLGLGDTLARGDAAGEMGGSLPVVSLGSARRATSLAAGAGHTCALLDDGSVKCWGANGNGRLGLGDTLARGDAAGEMGDSLPTVPLGSGRSASAIAAGNNHTCALLDNGTVKCWGANAVGQLGQGDTTARGDNANELGNTLNAVQLGTGRTAVAITAGSAFTCALLDNATVKCWGENASGRLGLGNTADRGDNAGEMGDNLPAVSLGVGRTALAITAGDAHACALLDNSTVKCWGENSSGRLGLGNTADRGDNANEMGDNLPAVNLGTGRLATGLTAGEAHICVLLDNATVKCWGENDFGRLGLGDANDRGDAPAEMGNALPAISLGTGRTATAISAGNLHTCASLDDGSRKCWGDNASGQLGLGDTGDRGDGAGEMGDSLAAVDLRPGRAIRTIDAGTQHVCALLDNGAVRCWGDGLSGRLGTGSTTVRGDNAGEMGDNLTTVPLGAGRTATALAAGGSHTCAILDNAQLKCWGTGSNGRLGIGTTDARGDTPGELGDALPAVDLGTGRTAVAVAAGGLHVCAILDTGQVKCWGFNSRGQLGLGDTADRGDTVGEMGNALPAVDLGTGRTAVAIDANGNHTCAVLDNGSVKCWGDNALGQLGLGDTAHRGDNAGEMGNTLPAVSLGTGRTAAALSVGSLHVCAVLDNASVKCWGLNSVGQLGIGGTDPRGDNAGEMGNTLPAVSLGTGRTVRSVAASSNHTCAVLDNDTVKCWGWNATGQLGLGDTATRGILAAEMGDGLPAVALGSGRTATGITIGGQAFSCATLDNGTAKCWGDNGFGLLGQGDSTDRGDQAGEMGDDLTAIDLGSAKPLGISGTVTTSGSGAPVARAFIAVLRASDFSMAAATVADPVGNYRIEVPPGGYYVYLVDPGGGHVSAFAGAPTIVEVTAPGMVDRDATLAPTRGSVVGKISDVGSGDELPGAWAVALTTTGAPERAALADASGVYRLDGLTAGNHYIGWLDPAGDHATRFAPDSPTVPGATLVNVIAGSEAESLGELPAQASTPGGAALTGTVTETGTNAPLADVLVIAMHAADFRLARIGVTNAAGAYSIDVAAGGYKLVFLDSTGRHAMEWHNNQPFFQIANAATVTAPTATNASLALSTGTVTGTVTDQDTGAPIGGAWAVAIGPTGAIAGAVLTRADGTYTLPGLAPGTYRATFVDPVGGRTQEYYLNSPTYAGGTNINVTANTTTASINAALTRP